MARIRQDTKTAALKRSRLLEGLSGRQLVQIARLSDDLEVPAGTTLCREGATGQEFFMIIDGEADVTRGGRHIAKLHGGDFFGEIALLERVRRTATVTAATPLSFFVVTQQAFNSVLATDPRIERQVLLALARRVMALSGDSLQ